MKRFYFIVFILFFFDNQLFTQNKILTSKFGVAYNLTKKASGSIIGLEYRNRLKNKHFIGVALENVFTSRRGTLPAELIAQKHILRDYSNPVPYVSFFDWNENSFPKTHLSSTPDKYFNFNVATKYFYQNSLKNGLIYTFGGGACLTYHDEMEIVDWKNGNFKSLGSKDLQDAWFPIFRYDTYLDIGIIAQAEAQKIIRNKFSVGASTKIYYFPSNKNISTNLELIFGVVF